MKFPSLRPAIAVLLALGLSACGGKAQFDVKGNIAGLRNAGLVLATGGQTVAPAANATTFSFPNTVSYGETVKVTIQAQPRHQTCSFDYTADPKVYEETAGRLAEISIGVTCLQNSYALGGTVSGLTADGLVLANGSSSQLVVIKGATTFSMPFNVADGDSYGIVVLTQPAGLRCTVANGTGIMGEAAVNNVAVSCVPA